MAIGSADGIVRLYSSTQQNKANTIIPGLGLPITAIDVSFDGARVLATTHSYLIVINTSYKVM